jgi:hypothetical protein
MRAPLIYLSAALSLIGFSNADRLEIYEYCYLSCTYSATFYTDYDHYNLGNLGSGCQGSGPVPGMKEICVDLLKKRAHFKFSHQSSKRCMKLVAYDYQDCSPATCGAYKFDEVDCTWREIPELDGEVVDSVSALPEPTAEAVRFKA